VRARNSALAAVAAALVSALAPESAAACTRWASPEGSNRSDGTQSAPFQTLNRLVGSLTAGEVGCLRPGATFTARLVVNRAGITIQTGPGGSRATIVGGIEVIDGADNVTLSHLRVRGDGRSRRAVVAIQANGVRLVRSDVTGLDVLNRSAPCVLLDGVFGVLLEGNEIHNCTRATTRHLYSAGIVAANAEATTIRHNFVYHTVGDGIVLAPNAHRMVVQNNIIDGNVGGVFLGGASSGNRVVDNVISYSGRHNVHASSLTGGDNLVAGNCVWRGFRGSIVGRGFRAIGNLRASPRYVDRSRTYRMRPGPCFSKRPYPRPVPGARQAPASRPAAPARRPARPRARPRSRPVRIAALPRFRVRYHLRALQTKVQIVRLEVAGLRRSVAIEARCTRACSAVERPLRRRDGTAVLTRLRGRWLPVGASLEIRTSRRGFAGHVARVTVTGLPDGVRIVHGCVPPGGTSAVSCRRYR
jgi:hypothetical protein